MSACSNAKKATKNIVELPADEERIFTDVQKQTFQYFWEGAEPTSGLARERFHVDNVYQMCIRDSHW